MKPPAIPHGALVRDYFAVLVSAIRQVLPAESIATSDLQAMKRTLDSFWLILSGELQESFLRLAHIIKSERARFNQMGHDGPAPAAEQSQQVVDQPALRRVPRDRRLEDVCSSDLLDTAQCFLGFEPVDHRLHRGVGGSLLCRKRFLNLPNGTGPPFPEGVHDL